MHFVADGGQVGEGSSSPIEWDVDVAEGDGVWLVSLRVGLSREGAAGIFGDDPLVSWPTDDVLVCDERVPITRGSMYLSQIASKPEGLQIAFGQKSGAFKAAMVLKHQLSRISGGE